MDAPPATPAKDVPAISAPAPDARAGLGYVSGRVGLGLGSGSEGVAGTYFASLEGWPLAYLGFGLDASRAATGGLNFLGPNTSASFQALRGKVSMRLRLGRSEGGVATYFLMGSVGLGPAMKRTTRQYESEPEPEDPDATYPSEDGCWLCDGYETDRTTETALGVLLEGGIFVRVWQAEFGAALRLDSVDGSAVFALTPSVGFEF